MSAEPFVIRRRIQFHETDVGGVVNFSNYFRLMEEAEYAFLAALGLKLMMDWEGQPVGWPRVSASCQYLAPLRFDDEVELRLRVTKVGVKSLSHEVEFVCRGQRMALGQITNAYCRLAPGRIEAMPIPPEIRAKLTNE